MQDSSLQNQIDPLLRTQTGAYKHRRQPTHTKFSKNATKRTDEDVAFAARDGVAAVQHVAGVGDDVALLFCIYVCVCFRFFLGGGECILVVMIFLGG